MSDNEKGERVLPLENTSVVHTTYNECSSLLVATEIAPEETVQEVVPQEESAPEEVESTQPEEAAAEEEAAAPEEKEEEAAPETKEDDVDDEDDDEEEDEEDVPRKQSGKELIEDLREHLNIIFIGHVGR